MTGPRVLVLGGYGLIGHACMKALHRAGCLVSGMGRSKARAQRADPERSWFIHDIPSVDAAEWDKILSGVDVVVNASGALQDGAADDLTAIHVHAVQRLAEAAQRVDVRVVQISAAGVSPQASTAFFRTKAQGDAALARLASDWVILRPTLVLSPEAYGGTALLRAAAAIPGIRPVILPGSMVQTVHVEDVADAVVRAAMNQVRSGTIADLTEPGSHSFPALLQKVRKWQGWHGKALPLLVPFALLRLVGKGADVLGHLGWRSPLRSTAIQALKDGVQGDATTWPHACRSLDETLTALPSTRQERVFARLYLMLPLAIGTLSLFWMLSGLIGLLETQSAMKILTDQGVSPGFSALAVGGGIIADIALGLAILWRRWTRLAALGMVAVSCAYLLGAAILVPGLWLDPLGPMLKVFPGAALAFLVWMVVEEQ